MNCGVTVILKYRNMIVNLRVTAAENSFLSRCTFYYLTIPRPCINETFKNVCLPRSLGFAK